jgi:dTMP kinase
VRGWFLSFEGVEGAGKSTQAARLRAALEARGYDVVVSREPGGTPLGAAIRELVLSGAFQTVPLAELFLMLADRAQHVAEVIRPALAAGRVVIADRYADATTAYQAGGRGLDPDLVARAIAAATAGLKPDLTLLLDVPVGAARERFRGRAADRLEAETLAFHERVRAAYRAAQEQEPGRIKIIDARADADTVHESVLVQVLSVIEAPRVNGPSRPPAGA